MLDSKIGYIICETATTEPTKPTIIGEKNNRIIIETNLQDANIKNRNGRWYDDKDLFPAIKAPRIQELIKNRSLFGESGHPMSKDISRQQTIDPNNISHEILKLWTEGDMVKAHVKGTPKQIGQEFNDLVADGTKVAFSLRALGSVDNSDPKKGAQVKNIHIITWDHVIFPSHANAYMTGLVSESAGFSNTANCKRILEANDKGLLTPITNQSVMSYIKSESANINTILKSFDTLYETASLVENGRKVQLVSREGDIFVVNLESYIQNEIMDYCYR